MVETIFYSWQSDSDEKFNRNFIKGCIEESIKRLNKQYYFEESIRIDQDTKDVPGHPDIMNTILDKIDNSDIIIADLTFVTKSSNGKNIPNPNVLIELGYAMSSLGTTNIIIVMNDKYGSPKDGLPFNLAHKRWPITYSLNSDSSPEEKSKEKTKLILSFLDAINLIFQYQVKSPKSLRELNSKPTKDNIIRVILESEEVDDWDVLISGQLQTAVFKHNVNLRIQINHEIEGVHSTNFSEKWATKHPDSHATSFYCITYYGQSSIMQNILVSVDGGRAFVPLPDLKTLTIDPLSYKITKIIDKADRTDEYIKRSGLKLSE